MNAVSVRTQSFLTFLRFFTIVSDTDAMEAIIMDEFILDANMKLVIVYNRDLTVGMVLSRLFEKRSVILTRSSLLFTSRRGSENGEGTSRSSSLHVTRQYYYTRTRLSRFDPMSDIHTVSM